MVLTLFWPGNKFKPVPFLEFFCPGFSSSVSILRSVTSPDPSSHHGVKLPQRWSSLSGGFSSSTQQQWRNPPSFLTPSVLHSDTSKALPSRLLLEFYAHLCIWRHSNYHYLPNKHFN
ncbi:hypothetical protein OJAV_G00155770 [Oryzias javanicus]|uniref:Uncharacterized protein n=1 Tax=Oryzias javanicus TaxID=123683 RepID=A0A437CHZ0_ORYJA|nr:hypothetical protein OJAV_G00155770 [Oryzias javanicus]